MMNHRVNKRKSVVYNLIRPSAPTVHQEMSSLIGITQKQLNPQNQTQLIKQKAN